MKWFKRKHKHKWDNIYLCGILHSKRIKLILVCCRECGEGKQNAFRLSDELDKTFAFTYNEKYYNEFDVNY